MTSLVLLGSYLLIGCLFTLIAVPLAQRRIKPNAFYGFRVRKTLRDPDTWYAVNAYFGRRFAVIGILIAAAGLIFLPLGLIPHVGASLYMAAGHTVLIVSLIWVTIDTFQYLRRF